MGDVMRRRRLDIPTETPTVFVLVIASYHGLVPVLEVI